jgi:hypothetical protein
LPFAGQRHVGAAEADVMTGGVTSGAHASMTRPEPLKNMPPLQRGGAAVAGTKAGRARLTSLAKKASSLMSPPSGPNSVFSVTSSTLLAPIGDESFDRTRAAHPA